MKKENTVDLSYKLPENESFTFSNKLCDKYYYLIACVIAFAYSVFGVYIFLIPIVLLKTGFNTSSVTEEVIYNYCGLPYLLADLPLLIVAIILFRKELKDDLLDFKNHILRNIIIIICSIAGILAMGYLFGFLYKAFNIVEDSTNEQAIILSLNGEYKIPMIIHLLFTGTFIEELIYRKFLYGFLNKLRFKPIFKVLLAIGLFALVHLLGQDFSDIKALMYVLNYLLLATCIVLPYYFSKMNIFTSYACHFFNNLLGVIELLGVISVIICK